MAKLLFVFNPHSGKGLIKSHLLNIINIFTQNGYDVTVRPTQHRLDAYEYISSHAGGYDRIVVSGGDGTLNEAVQGLMNFDISERRPLGYIPSGTTNDFASALNIPRDITKAADVAINGTPFKCDIGSFNGKMFNYVAAFGAFTDVSYDTPQEIKNTFGHAAYILEGIRRLTTLKSHRVHIKYDDGEIDEEVFLCLIMNATSIGGVLDTEKYMNVDLSDGLFEMLVFRQPASPGLFLRVLSSITTGENLEENVRLVRSSHFEITSDDNIKWTLDGEYGGETNNAVIDVLSSAITYITGVTD